jgi:hypothetical protein
VYKGLKEGNKSPDLQLLPAAQHQYF